MKIIIAGGGFIARTHLSAIRSLGHEVTWIVGRNAVRTQAFAEENKIPDWTIDIDEALSSDAEIVRKLVEYGIDDISVTPTNILVVREIIRNME